MTWRFKACAMAATAALLAIPAIAHEIRHGNGMEAAAKGLSGACGAMSGSYAVAPLADTAEFSGLVREYLHPEYVVGQPAFALRIDAETMTRTGAISKETTGLRLPDRVASRDLFGDAPIGCALSDAESYNDMQLVHVDLSGVPDAQLRELADYLDSFWNSKVDLDALRGIRDFIAIDHSMVGVAGIFVLIPLRKI